MGMGPFLIKRVCNLIIQVREQQEQSSKSGNTGCCAFLTSISCIVLFAAAAVSIAAVSGVGTLTVSPTEWSPAPSLSSLSCEVALCCILHSPSWRIGTICVQNACLSDDDPWQTVVIGVGFSLFRAPWFHTRLSPTWSQEHSDRPKGPNCPLETGCRREVVLEFDTLRSSLVVFVVYMELREFWQQQQQQ